jgi:hypothetical protein
MKITPHVIYKNPNHGCPKQNKFVVDNLPFPSPHTRYNARWQKEFHPTLILWASTFTDPYATNSALSKSVVMEIWDMIYPDIDLINVDHRETAPKVVYLVCDILYYHYGSRVISLQAGAILHDWCSAIGAGALAVVRNHFLLPGNWFNKEHIIKYVRWGLNPKKFNFIYGHSNTEAV